jgi:hypothetical protein
MLLLRVPERKGKLGWGVDSQDKCFALWACCIVWILGLNDVRVGVTYGKTCRLSRRTRRKRKSLQYDRPLACRRLPLSASHRVESGTADRADPGQSSATQSRLKAW